MKTFSPRNNVFKMYHLNKVILVHFEKKLIFALVDGKDLAINREYFALAVYVSMLTTEQ